MLSVPETVFSTADEEIRACPVVFHVIFGAGTPVEVQLNLTELDIFRV